MMVLEVTMDLMQPRLIQRMIDQGIAAGDLGLVLRTGGWMLLLALIGLATGAACAVYAIRAGQYFGADVRSALFRRG